MTKLLEAALKKLAALPAEQQENIALLILKEIGKQIDNEPIEADELPSSIGMGASGTFDLSTHCEELLWQDEKY
jgi:hypothetical protein